MTGKLFTSAAAVGTGLGILAVFLVFWPVRDDGFGSSSLGYLGIPLASGAMAGLLMGLICCSGAYVAIEIQATRNQAATAASQATAAGIGAAVASLLPAMAIAALGLNEIGPAPLLVVALGILVVSFAAGFAIVAGLIRCQARG